MEGDGDPDFVRIRLGDLGVSEERDGSVGAFDFKPLLRFVVRIRRAEVVKDTCCEEQRLLLGLAPDVLRLAGDERKGVEVDAEAVVEDCGVQMPACVRVGGLGDWVGGDDRWDWRWFA